MNRYALGLMGFALLLVSEARPAIAQRAAGFALDRFDPSERGSVWFTLDSLDIRGHLRPAAGVVGEWAYKPLVIYSDDGSERAAVVHDQVFTHVGASLVTWDRVRFALNVPISVVQSGDSGEAGGVRYVAPDKTVVGDVRVGADVRLIGKPQQALTLAVGPQLYLPTGCRAQYAGDGSVRVVLPRFQAAGEVGSFIYAARLGFAYRPRSDSFGAGRPGSEVIFGGAVGLQLADRKVVVGPEIFGSTVVANADAFLSKTGTPLEALFGMRYMDPSGVRIGGGFGPGLTRGLGTPGLRFVMSVEWAPTYEEWNRELTPTDRDNDGVPDESDACPDKAGPGSADPSKNGCPPPSDRDNDGVLDADDACPDEPGPRSDDPAKDGCPRPADRDGDGVLDAEDACPDKAGPGSANPKTNGCPLETDGDNDGVPDAQDACPTQVGQRSKDPKKNGCPGAEADQVKITGQVKFDANSAAILAEHEAMLNGVVKTLTEHREIQWVRVEGHADGRGEAKNGKALSIKRAEAVVKWLSDHGVDLDRLMSQGFGSERPIDSNDTEEGRRNNRRVEFHVGGTGK